MRTGERRIVLLAGLLVALGAGCGGGDDSESTNPVAPSTSGEVLGQATSATPPSGLVLPVDLSQINLRGVINPFGVVRSSLDEGRVGHPGIDLPSNTGAPFYAVADGRIVSVMPVTDGRPGSAVKLLVAEGAMAGTGWVFLYEHMVLVSGLGVDSRVTQGELIGSNPLDPAITNHLELAWVFNDFLFHQNQTCWITQLGPSGEAAFTAAFNNSFRTDQRFVDAWTSVTREGRLPFRELLNPVRFPEGAQLCYLPGTDVRVEP